MNKAANKPSAASRKVPSKLNIAAAVAPAQEVVMMKKTSTAYAAGFLTCAQQLKQILTTKARSFGEALDQINQIENEVQGKLLAGVDAELKAKRIKLEGKNIFTENTPEGPTIVIRPIALTPDVQKQIADAEAALKKAPALAAKKAPAKAPVKAVAAPVTPAAAPVAEARTKRPYNRKAK